MLRVYKTLLEVDWLESLGAEANPELPRDRVYRVGGDFLLALCLADAGALQECQLQWREPSAQEPHHVHVPPRLHMQR